MGTAGAQETSAYHFHAKSSGHARASFLEAKKINTIRKHYADARSSLVSNIDDSANGFLRRRWNDSHSSSRDVHHWWHQGVQQVALLGKPPHVLIEGSAHTGNSSLNLSHDPLLRFQIARWQSSCSPTTLGSEMIYLNQLHITGRGPIHQILWPSIGDHLAKEFPWLQLLPRPFVGPREISSTM
ncbi:hypothetical protein M9H77_25951 [Catharanthus roseus]|uniref:Uncharacterized protein n=1 Tax=Catharanthus roseus TaxID=4058 RepID=A0ACC0ACK2_CATRO|nr:hypothetical protein M9H77_25951 [Catharanthus roseus]